MRYPPTSGGNRGNEGLFLSFGAYILSEYKKSKCYLFCGIGGILVFAGWSLIDFKTLIRTLLNPY